jgi:hypothetical protein
VNRPQLEAAVRRALSAVAPAAATAHLNDATDVILAAADAYRRPPSRRPSVTALAEMERRRACWLSSDTDETRAVRRDVLYAEVGEFERAARVAA